MQYNKIISYAKINISLGVIKKLKSKLHQIESLISFIDLYDEILIKKISKKKHSIIFYGKFSKNIPKNNTISKLLSILDNKNLLEDKKYQIFIKKNIPIKSGLGGGSMNASSVLKYFLKKKIIKLNKKTVYKIANQVGADVAIGLANKNSFLYTKGKIFKSIKKIRFYIVLVKPNFGCSTKVIYKNVKSFSKSKFNNKIKEIYNFSFIKKLSNDLEMPAFKKYPRLLTLKNSMLKLSNISMVRMTGSGSTMIAYFKSKKTSLNAAKILSRKYKNYWCILSKTI